MCAIQAFIYRHTHTHHSLPPSVCKHDNQHKQMENSDITHTEEAPFSVLLVEGHFYHLLCTRFPPQVFFPLCPTPGFSAVQ